MAECLSRSLFLKKRVKEERKKRKRVEVGFC